MILGIASLGHDASVALIDHDEIKFAAHAERYSKFKNDGNINEDILEEAMKYASIDDIEHIVWYEKPWKKKLRNIYAGQWDDLKIISPQAHIHELAPWLSHIPLNFISHHKSHAAAGYYTSIFDEAAVLVVDAIGEYDCISVWHGQGCHLKKITSINYPHSIGLLYSAFTQRCGFKPNEEEYILMGMAALGKPIYVDDIKKDFIKNADGINFKLKQNVHRGIRHWRPDIIDVENLAASIQKIAEDYLLSLVQWVAKHVPSKHLVYMGGVALNCVANTKIAQSHLFDDIWIMPNPGDAGNSLGAALAYSKKHIEWKHPYLGTNIEREFDYEGALNALVAGEVIGIANGRAEWGPRALGNRSLVSDARGSDVKDRVNGIKKRELFRPFAPIILEEYADQYFDMPVKHSPYMQFVADCKYPDLFPAICHFDGTSRVQTLNERDNPVLHKLLTMFMKRTGSPILLNTSLNIKGQPLVDTWEDALEFQKKYKIKMF